MRWLAAAATSLSRLAIRELSWRTVRPALVVSGSRSFASSSATKESHDSADSELQPQHQHHGLFRLLTDDQRRLLDEQRSIVQKVRDVASQVGGGVELRDCRGGLGPLAGALPDENERSHREGALDSTFLVVIAGEFNAGKSTLLNALLGDKLLETGALPTTDTVQVLAYDNGNTSSASAETVDAAGGFVFHRHSSPLLQDLTLIDTPGTNAVHADHTKITQKLLPVADLILFVTSADRPFPESERVLLRSIQSYRKNVAIVLNKLDTLDMSGGNHGQKEKERMVSFVSEHASNLLGARPVVLAISARDALGCKSMNPDGRWADNALWKRSNFSDLEVFLSETLTDVVKVRSKMLNPLGVAEGMLDDCIVSLKSQRIELETDVATLRLLESQMDGWSLEMEVDMTKFREEAGNVLQAEGERCREFIKRMSYFDQWRWSVLGDSLAFETAWISADRGPSSGGVEYELLNLVRDISDNIATRARVQGQAVIEYLGKRPAVTSQSLIGSVNAASRFEDTRKEMQGKMSDSVKHICSTHDPTREKEVALQSLRGTALVSGALYTGALLDGAATAIGMLDWIFGLSSASALAIVGASFLPYRNRNLAAAHQQQWDQRREKLDSALSSVCSKEAERIKTRILNGIAPYTRFVNTERERTERLMDESEALVTAANSLRNRIIKLTE